MHQAAKKTEVNWIICLQLFLFSLPLARFTRMESTSLSHWFGASTRGICGRIDSMLAPSQGHVFLLTLPIQLPPYTEKSPPKEPLVQRTGDEWSSPDPVHSLKQSCLASPERRINSFFWRFLVTCYAALMQQKPNAMAMDSALTEGFCCSLGKNAH